MLIQEGGKSCILWGKRHQYDMNRIVTAIFPSFCLLFHSICFHFHLVDCWTNHLIVFFVFSMCCPRVPVSCCDTGECHTLMTMNHTVLSLLLFFSLMLSLLAPPKFRCQALNTPTKGPSILFRHPVIILIKCNYHHTEDNWVLLTALFLLPLVPHQSTTIDTHTDNNCPRQELKAMQACGLKSNGGGG